MNVTISPRTASFAAGAILVTSVLLHERKNIATCYRRRRGIRGIARWIWLGDHLPPKLRQSMDELDEIQERMTKSEQELEKIEISVERIRLESIDVDNDDDGDSDIILNSTRTEMQSSSLIFQQCPELRTQIGIFSSTLDKIAASIDAVKSHSDDEVKKRKKQLSNGIVKLMNDLDSIITSIQGSVDRN